LVLLRHNFSYSVVTWPLLPPPPLPPLLLLLLLL
jgi:hypothetical protein